MTQAGLLLLLWDALQQRQTTFGQVLDLSAACGLDGRRVLADHFDSQLGHGRPRFLRGPVVGNSQIAARCEQAGPISAPGERFANGLARPARVVLLKKEQPVNAIYTDKELSHTVTREAALNINRGAIAEFLVMATMVKLMVCPFPKPSTSILHSSPIPRSVLSINFMPFKVYKPNTRLSIILQPRAASIVSGGFQ